MNSTHIRFDPAVRYGGRIQVAVLLVATATAIATGTAAAAVAGARAPAGGADADGDGLLDVREIELGMDPRDVDSDCDALDDATEVGPDPANPLDADGDGLIDALESNRIDSDLDGVLDPDDPSSGWQPSCARFRPFAIRTDGSDTTRLAVRIAGGASVMSVEVGNSFPAPGLLVDGVPFPQSGATIALYDDGTHGDLVAGDGLWSRGGISSQTAALPPSDRVLDTITVTDAGGTSTQELMRVGGGGSSRMAVGVVDPADVVPARQVAPKMRAVRHTVNLVDPAAMLEVQRYLTFQAPWAPELATQAFYSVYGDDYDFIFLSPGEPTFRAYAGVSGVVSNQVQGLGRPIADNTALWGSAGRLQAVIGRNLDDNGPNLHEIVHRWATSLSTSLGFGQCAPGHWGWIGIQTGQLGGFDPATLLDNGDGTYTVDLFPGGGRGVDHEPFNPLELYLAGWIAPEDVPLMTMPVDVDCGSGECPGGDCSSWRFAADGLELLAIDDVIAIHGPRVPDVTASQKDFDLAWIVASQEPLTDVELAYFGWQADYLGRAEGNGGYFIPFEQATGGRATLDTAVEVSGPAGEVSGVRMSRSAAGAIELSWDASCRATDADYAVYEGTFDDFRDYAPRTCRTGGRPRLDVSDGAGNAFFLVVPLSADFEGGYGTNGEGEPRPPSATPCRVSLPAGCS